MRLYLSMPVMVMMRRSMFFGVEMKYWVWMPVARIGVGKFRADFLGEGRVRVGSEVKVRVESWVGWGFGLVL